MAKQRVGSPVGVALVAAVLAGLVTALVLSFVLEDDSGSADQVAHLTLAPEDTTVGLTAPQVDISGEPAPDFAYPPLDGGDDVGFDQLRDGRPAVINFFGSWCVPCVAEMPDLEAAHQQYGDRVTFLGLATRDRPEAAQDIVDRTGVTYATGRDPGDIITEFEATYTPTTVFVRADGTILRSHTGRIYPDDLQAALDELVT